MALRAKRICLLASSAGSAVELSCDGSSAQDHPGIRTRELIYANRFGQVVWRELRGTDAGLDPPQFCIHRGKLPGVLLEAVRARLGPRAHRLPPGRRRRTPRSSPRRHSCPKRG
jgi:hypothetical protein